MPVHDSDMAAITQHHLTLLAIQNEESVEQLDKKMCRGEGEDKMAVMDAVVVNGSLQDRSMPWVVLTKRFLLILDLVDPDPDVY